MNWTILRTIDLSVREKVAWWLFVLLLAHLVFLQPRYVLVPGERSNLLSGLFCAGNLILVLILGNTDRLRAQKREIIISIILATLVVLSCLFSLSPKTSLARGFVILSSALAGFWCSRILLSTGERQKAFQWICVLILAALLVVDTVSWIIFGNIYHLVDVHWHPMTSRIILLSFAPIALVVGPDSRASRILGGLLLVASYFVLLIGRQTSGMESAAAIPVIMLLLAACFLSWRRSLMVPVFLGLFLVSMWAGNYYPRHTDKKFMSMSYRTENIFFSWEIAKTFPILGIGLWAPRDVILDNYQIRYPSLSKETFVRWTHWIRSSENNFLTFLADLGIPFTVLYVCILVVLWLRLLRLVCTQPRGAPFPPLALLLPITGILLQLQVLDGLFHPQISWLFHVLLGMIPRPDPSSRLCSAVLKRAVYKGLVLVGVAVLGILLGSWLPSG
jgi:O-Antigen ligase